MKKTYFAFCLLLSNAAIAEEKVCITQTEYNMALDRIQGIAEMMATSKNFVDQLETLSVVRGSLAEGKSILDVIENIDSISNSFIRMAKTSLEVVEDSDYRERVISNFKKIQSLRLELPTNTSSGFQGELDQIILELEEGS